MHIDDEPDTDLGQPHNVAMLVEDSTGATLTAYFDDDTWWEGHPDPGCTRAQTEHRIVAIAPKLTAEEADDILARLSDVVTPPEVPPQPIPEPITKRIADWKARLEAIREEVRAAAALDLDGEDSALIRFSSILSLPIGFATEFAEDMEAQHGAG